MGIFQAHSADRFPWFSLSSFGKFDEIISSLSQRSRPKATRPPKAQSERSDVIKENLRFEIPNTQVW